MHTKLNTAAALVVAALVAAPGLALANDSAAVVTGSKTDAVPVASLTGMIGTWQQGDLAMLDKATSIKVYDTKLVYQPADLSKIASAETGKAMELGKFRDAIRADAGLAGWFKTHNIDVNRVVAVADPSGNPQIFLY